MLDRHSNPFLNTPSAVLKSYQGLLLAWPRDRSDKAPFEPHTVLALDRTDTWQPYLSLDNQPDLLDITTLNNHLLAFYADRVEYNGQLIFAARPAYILGYYSEGQLFVHTTEVAPQLYVCSWTYTDESPIDPAACEHFTLDQGPEKNHYALPYAFARFKNEVLIALNTGTIYRYRNGNVDVLYDNSAGKDWQVYSMVNWYGQVYLGHFPSGSLYVYNGDTLAELSPAIPVPKQVLAQGREAQTLAIYRGELYVGVWPWGEIWRLPSPAGEWEYVGRAFDQPAMTTKDLEPYRAEVAASNPRIERNAWGQRILSLVPYRDALYISTMNKRGLMYKTHPEASALDQYGAVLTLHADANIACDFEWKPQTTLRFVLETAGIMLYQDDHLLCVLPLAEGQINRIDAARLTVGDGAFGAYHGQTISVNIR